MSGTERQAGRSRCAQIRAISFAGDGDELLGTETMRMFIGMILGALLTVGAAFIHDTWTTGPSTTGTSTNAVAARPMVNWDVVGENWRVVSERARETWTTLAHKITS